LFLEIAQPVGAALFAVIGVVVALRLPDYATPSGARYATEAERVCVPEANAVEEPEDLDLAEVVSLVFTYMTAYQLLHRRRKSSAASRCS
jgi:NADPH:quinone reductase-like Zn-dependent oxidoreductase